MTNGRVHDSNLNRILLRPREILGIEKIIIAGTMNLFNNNGQLIGQPDGILFDNKGNVYNMEYKTTINSFDKSMRQAIRNSRCLYKELGWNPTNLCVHGVNGKYIIEEV